MKTVRFRIDRASAGLDILAGNQQMQELTYSTAQRILATVSNNFYMEFGVLGEFELSEGLTDRYTVAIRAANSRTGAILSKHPRWLAQFVNNINI